MEPSAEKRTIEQKWPQTMWIVRHGQSAGNVARDAAEAAGLPLIDILTRDVDTPLSDLGKEQAQALGRWFGEMGPGERPSVVLSSPYVRARQTAQIVLQTAGLPLDAITFNTDERLREKEFGILDRLTKHGILKKYPELGEQRAHVGKFYFRPPGGESWCDVILRLRSLLDTLFLHHEGQRVLIVAHQVVVLCLRYLLESMDEAQILAVDRAGDVANCSVTEYAPNASGLRLLRYNHTIPLQREGEPVTAAPDSPVAAR